MLAMLFLVLFAAMAVGFYAATNTSVQVAGSERLEAETRLAAESGLTFLRYQLAQVPIPPNTPPADVPALLEAGLKARLENTPNLGGALVTRSGDTITIPAIDLGDGTRFSGRMEWSAPELRVAVTGGSPSALAGAGEYTRGVRLGFLVKQKRSPVLNYGVASKGRVQIKASAATKVLGTPDEAASVLSAHTGTPSIVTGNGPIEGSLAVVVAKSQVQLGGGRVGQSTVASTIMADYVEVVPTPEFPTVDTTAFKPLAVNVYTSGRSYYKNIRVPPNTNPRFNGGDVIDGILYIESPNNVTFRGHATVNGVIVFENKGDPSVNRMDFRGNVSPEAIPDTAEFDAVREAAQGLAIAAPTAWVVMSGSVDGLLKGSVIAYQVTLSGSADLVLQRGSIITLGPNLTDVAGKTVHFEGTAANNPPTFGVHFSGAFAPQPHTYAEINR